jgi:catechol 2,3-dioxygenase-like lactoylglutathione lyase family enzyme
MSSKLNYILLLSAIILVSSQVFQPVFAQQAESGATGTPDDHNALPSLEASVLFHYYDDLDAAKQWYKDKIGWEMVADYGWFAVFKMTPTSYLGLTSTGEDAPKSKKSSGFNISTNDLGAWHAHLAKNPDIKFLNHIESTAGGLVEQFKVEDPGGYSLEFFRWSAGPDVDYSQIQNPFEK